MEICVKNCAINLKKNNLYPTTYLLLRKLNLLGCYKPCRVTKGDVLLLTTICQFYEKKKNCITLTRKIFLFDNNKKNCFVLTAKSQLISKCLFGTIVSTKKTTKFFKEFLPQPLRGQIKKINALFYTNQGLFNIFGKISF